MTIYSLEYVVGGVFVALYAFERINTPKISLENTTPQRYWSMVAAYAFASVVLYFTLAMSLGMVGLETLKQFEILPGAINETSPPVLMALLLTVLMSKIPGLSKIDEAVRREFRQRASMSRIAGNVSHLLERSPLQLQPAQETAIVAALKEQGIGADDIVFVDNGSPQYAWTRISVLLTTLRRWRHEPEYDDFVNAFHPEWEGLIEEAERCEGKAIRCFRLAKVPGDDAALSSALKDCSRHYSKQLDDLLKRISDFMGRGVAHVCGHRPERLRQALVAVGLDIHSDVGYTVHQIAFVIMAALGVSVLVPLLITLLTGQDYGVGSYVFKVAAGYTIAALVALHLHYHYGRPVHGSAVRPWGRYLAAGVVTSLITVPLVLIFDTLIRYDVASVFQRFVDYGYVYQLRPLALAILLAYLIDTRVAAEQLRAQQWKETAATAACMAVVSGAIVLLLEGIAQAHPAYQVRVPVASTMILSAAVLGAMIGYWLPTSTRRVAERVPERDNIGAAGVPAGAGAPSPPVPG